MNRVDIPNSLSVGGWNGEKTALAKDKAVASKVTTETTKLTDAIKALDSAVSKVNFDLGETKNLASLAAAEAAVAKLEAAAKGEVKNALGAAKMAAAAADTLAAAVEKAQKGLPAPSLKVAVAAKAAAAAASKAAGKFATDLSAAVEAGRDELQALAAKLKAGDKKGGAGAPVSPKALADSKAIAALIKKSIGVLRTPKGSPVPIRFMVLQENKKLRIYLGPKPDSGLAKLKTQFAPKAKIKRVKDAKGSVVWEKGFLTFMSDILKGGLVKQIQIAIREQTKLNVKVRIKRTDGGVDEAADAPDLTDDQLKVDPAEEAEMLAAGKAYESRLKALQNEIATASKGASAAKVKQLVATINSAGKAQKFADASDLLDELESLLEEGDVTDSDGKDLEVDDDAAGGGDKGVAPAKALLAKFAALRSKIDAAVAAGGAAGKQIKDYADAAEKLAKTEVADNVAKANLFVNKIEQMLGDAAGAAAGGGVSVEKLTVAHQNWLKSRDSAIKEITTLSKAIVAAFAKETTQAPAVKDAIRKLAELQVKLKSGLDGDVEAAIKAKDDKARTQSATKAKNSLTSIRKFIEEDELMKNLDNNEIIKTMSVVGPMKSSLQAIEAALG
jgi:trimeric autotransporter adhesin